MSSIQPYSSFNTDSLFADFPAAKLLWHMDDFTSGGTTWTDRVSGVILNFTAAVTKDSKGLYSTTASNGVASVTGTMPTLSSKYVVALSIGDLQDASATAGLNITFGSSTAIGITNGGFCVNAVNAVDVTTLTGSITAGSLACKAAYFDMVDTTSPLVASVLASGLSTDQAIPGGSDTTTDNLGQIALGGALTSAFSIASINATTAGM
jgi:hypothetical protein